MLRALFFSCLLLAGCNHHQKKPAENRVSAADELNIFKTHLNLIRGYLKNNEPQVALSLIEPMLLKNPEAPELYNLKGVALDHLREHLEAQRVYEDGLKRFPNDRQMMKNLALSKSVMVQG